MPPNTFLSPEELSTFWSHVGNTTTIYVSLSSITDTTSNYQSQASYDEQMGRCIRIGFTVLRRKEIKWH